jgi:hypothetical protein
MTTLADQIASYLAGTGRPQSAQEIAVALRRRHLSVLQTLQSDPRFYRWPHERKKLYGVHVGPWGAGEPFPFTSGGF